MRRYQRVLVAAGLAAGAALAAASPAQAATGTLILHSGSFQAVYQNPPPGCITSRTAFDAVTNRTDTPVVAYTGFACTGQSLVVNPGGWTTPVGSRQSVRVLA